MSNVRAHGVTRRTLAASILAAMVLIAVAIAFGWRSYEANPEGIFLYTPKNWCEPRSHSFTIAFHLALLLGGLLLSVVAILAFTVSLLPAMSRKVLILRNVAKASLAALLPLALGALLSIPLEAQLPLRKSAACVQNAP
jgi:hypothetical protein